MSRTAVKTEFPLVTAGLFTTIVIWILIGLGFHASRLVVMPS